MSRTHRLWRSLTAPWLARLLRERTMCRVLFVVVALLLGAHRLGWSLWSCMFAQATGRPCPGCGLTRAMQALGRGDWPTVMFYHPFAPFFALVGLFVGACAWLPRRQAEVIADKVDSFERRTALPALVMVIFLCFGLLRMAGLWHNERTHLLVPAKFAPRVLGGGG